MKNINKKQLLVTTLLSGAAFSMMAAPSYAQTAGDDEIVVTGSRIAKKDFISNSPVATVDAVQFEAVGAINTESLLNELPQTVPGLDRTSNNPGNGTATVDLRGLGSNRTLVLINGRRAMPNGAAGIVDINTIAPAMIKNVEVLTGGASSVYGADAVAGVVNFILKDDFEGVEANFGYQSTDKGDAGQASMDLTIGANSPDGKGNATINLSYTDRQELFQGDRDFAFFSQSDGDGVLVPGGSSGVPQNSIFNGGFLSTSSCGVLVPNPNDDCPADQLTSTTGAFPNTAGLLFNNDGTTREFITAGDPNDFYNYAPVNFIQLPQERFTLSGTAHYEINEHAEVFLEGRFAQNTVPSQLAPTPIFETTTFSLDGNPFIAAGSQQSISGNNTNLVGIGDRVARQLENPDGFFVTQVDPDDPDALPRNLCTNCIFDSDGDGYNDTTALIDTDNDGIADTATGLLRRRLVEVGPRFGSDTRDTFQFVGGVRGNITGEWDYEIFHSEGRTQQSTFQTGNVNRGRFRQALLLADADGDGEVDLDANGNPTCSNTSANGSTVGCTPLNLFGQGNISEDAAAFLRTAVSTTAETLQRVTQANITGQLGSFGWAESPIGIAIGAEYIDNQFVFRPSQDVAASTIAGFNGAPPVSGEFDQYSAYGELAIPLVEGKAFADRISLDLAGRVTDFSTVGTEYNYKIGGDWAINDQIRFRGNFNTAARTPNIGELFAPQGENFPGAADLCSAGDAPEAGLDAFGVAACIATGVPAALVGTPAINTAAGQIRSLVGGNPNLEVEEAETITIGAVLNPNAVEGLTLSVDYFDIDITNSIAAFGGGTNNIISVCVTDQELGGPGSPFCNAISRAPDGSINRPGFVSNLASNFAGQTLQGFDIAASYNRDLSDLGTVGEFLGNLSFNYLGTYTLENTFTAFDGANTLDCAGFFGTNCGEPDPEYRHRTSARFSKNALSTQITWQYIGGVDDAFAFNDSAEPVVSSIKAFNYFDASVNWDVTDYLGLTIGANNVFDKAPPILGDNQEQANTFPATYDVYGRTFFANAKFKF